jgi:hypothetical protein
VCGLVELSEGLWSVVYSVHLVRSSVSLCVCCRTVGGAVVHGHVDGDERRRALRRRDPYLWGVCILGVQHGDHPVSHGGAVCLPTHAPSTLVSTRNIINSSVMVG